MDNSSFPDVRLVDRHEGGLIITFANGRAAFYSSSLLYSVISQATEIADANPGPETSMGEI